MELFYLIVFILLVLIAGFYLYRYVKKKKNTALDADNVDRTNIKDAVEIANVYQEARSNNQSEHVAFLKVKGDLMKIYDESGISELSDIMMKATDICCVETKDAEVFGEGFFTIIAGGGDSLREGEALLFEKLVERFPGSTNLLEMLADIYGIIINETENEEYTKKLEVLSQNNPALVNPALQLVHALNGLYYKNDLNVNEYREAAQKIKVFYEKYHQLDFAREYSDSLKRCLYEQNEEEAQKTLLVLKELVDEWKDSFIADNYLDALSKSTWKQDEEGCKETIQLMEELWNVTPFEEKRLAMHLAYTLANYYLCDLSAEEKGLIVNRIKELSTYWQPALNMAEEIQSEKGYQYAHKPVKAK